MAQSVNFEYDIFISYASADNDLPAPFDRWVSHFVDSLQKMLKARLGGDEPRIYFGERTTEANHRLDEILSACRRSKLFLAISSPAYHKREWTRLEVNTFVETNADPRCIFLVESARLNRTDRLETLRERNASRFYRSNPEGNVTLPLRPGEQDFYVRLVDVSESIAKQLAEISEHDRHPVSAPTTAPSGKTLLGPVLLAQTTDDLEDERDAVKRYLQQFGVEVLPVGDYPQGGQAFQDAFRADLKRAQLVVQLLSVRSGRVPPDLPKGYARFQADSTHEAKVALVQWRRSDVQLEKVVEAAQRELLTGPEVIASTLEQFKNEVLKRLESKPEPVQKSEFLLFVNAEKADQDAARHVREALGDSCWVYTPQEGNSESIQAEFNEALGECDALLLLYGKVEPAWVVRQMLHLRKARAGKPRIPGAICYGPPANKPEISMSMPGFRPVICISQGGTDWAVDQVAALLPELRK